MDLVLHRAVRTKYREHELQAHLHSFWNVLLARITLIACQHFVWVNFANITYLMNVPDRKHPTDYTL